MNENIIIQIQILFFHYKIKINITINISHDIDTTLPGQIREFYLSISLN